MSNRRDQTALREWLLEEVEEEIDGERKTLSRENMAKELHAHFLQKRNKWNLEKKDQYEIYKNNNNLDAYAQWLSDIAPIREGELNSFYKDTITDGRYGDVLNLLAFLSVATAPETVPPELSKK